MELIKKKRMEVYENEGYLCCDGILICELTAENKEIIKHYMEKVPSVAELLEKDMKTFSRHG